jgi:hypothetical protein
MDKNKINVVFKWTVSTLAFLVIGFCVYKFVNLNSLNSSIELRSSFLLYSTVPFIVALVWFPLLAFLELRANAPENIEDLDGYKFASSNIERDLFLLRKEIDRRIERLILNGNISLSIAISCALIGGGVLFFVSVKQENFDIINIASRFGLVLLIETIAFFFLRIYRVIIDEITYFTNERTNILLKSTALRAVIGENTFKISEEERNKFFQEIVHQFVVEERNPKMLNGESNMKLKTIEIEKDTLKSFVEKLNQIIDKLPLKN